MSSFFANPTIGDASIHCLGSVSQPIINTLYPLKALTDFHIKHHLVGLDHITGPWMDKGGMALGGQFGSQVFRGNFHRLGFGHHLFEDGFKVLFNPDYSYREFLHHLGLDFLTARGIPNPLIPTAFAETLAKTIPESFTNLLGMSPAKFAYECCTINLPKVLSGGCSLICAGKDVFLAFSDKIPHTFAAAGVNFGFGILDTAVGLFPPNPLLLTAGACEFGVGTVTAYRALVDPLLPVVNTPASVFLPALGKSIAFAGLISACTSYFTGQSFEESTKSLAASIVSATTATTATTAAAAAKSCFLGPFLGPAVGLTTFFIVKKMLDSLGSNPRPDSVVYEEYVNQESFNYFNNSSTMAMPYIPEEPIGMIKGDDLLLNKKAIIDLMVKSTN